MCESKCKCTCDKKESAPVKVPHKHAELIKAWADGAEIEYFSEISRCWERSLSPSWYNSFEYRIKPEPKPDLVKFGCSFLGTSLIHNK